MSFLRLVQLKRGLMARLVALGLMPGEPAVVWDDDSKPRLLIGDRAGVPRELQPGQHTHPDADLDGISWTKVTQVPATFPPAVHVHVIGDVTGLQVALDGKAALGHTHDFSAVYAPLNHTHAWSQLTGVPATFTPPMASGVTLGGIKVGGGLAIDAQGVLSTTYTYSLPTASGATLGGIKVGGGLSIDAQGVLSATYSYTLPVATGTVLGGVKAGTGVSIDAGGALTVTYAATAGSANAVAWTAVTGRPTALSSFANDPGYLTASALAPYAPLMRPILGGGGVQAVSSTGSGGGQLEVRADGSAGMAAMIAFHRPGIFAAYLGLDTDNQFKVGGWSMGGAAYTLIHSGNIGAQSVTYAASAGAVSWTAVTGRPTALSAFVNDPGFLTSSGTIATANRLGGGSAWTGEDTLTFAQRNAKGVSFGRSMGASDAPGGEGGSFVYLLLPEVIGGYSQAMLALGAGANASAYIGGGAWNGVPTWQKIITSANIGAQNVNYAGSATYLTSSGQDVGTVGTMHATNWWRSQGTTGWYNETYAVGIYATSTGLIQTYNGASFQVNGALYATGNVTAYYSDERLKENIRPIKGALTKALAIRGVTFNANALAAELGYLDASEQVGVIAQEVQRVLPQVIAPAPFDLEIGEDGEARSKTGLDFLTVRYERLVPLLFEALREEHELRLKDHQVMREEMGLLRLSLLKLETEVKTMKRQVD